MTWNVISSYSLNLINLNQFIMIGGFVTDSHLTLKWIEKEKLLLLLILFSYPLLILTLLLDGMTVVTINITEYYCIEEKIQWNTDLEFGLVSFILLSFFLSFFLLSILILLCCAKMVIRYDFNEMKWCIWNSSECWIYTKGNYISK